MLVSLGVWVVFANGLRASAGRLPHLALPHPTDKGVRWNRKKVNVMWPWRRNFLTLGLLWAFLGFVEVAPALVGIARILFLVFIILFVVSYLRE
jgi:uncharacterized membrane protein YtjA (UPF0391 family)